MIGRPGGSFAAALRRSAADAGSGAPPQRELRPCPICGRPAAAAAKPFCSLRCSEIDLHRWFSESYAVPVAAAEEHGLDGPDEAVEGG